MDKKPMCKSSYVCPITNHGILSCLPVTEAIYHYPCIFRLAIMTFEKRKSWHEWVNYRILSK